MPALDWRIIPARSISRCETICASLGFSRKTGRKYLESRIKPNHGIGRRTLGKTWEPVHPRRWRQLDYVAEKAWHAPPSEFWDRAARQPLMTRLCFTLV